MAWEVRIWCRIHEEAPNRHVRGGEGGSGSCPPGKWGILHSPEDPERLWRCQTELPRRRTDGQSPGPAPRQSVWGGPLGVGPAPSPPQPRDRVSGFPPEPADPASSAGAVGKSRRPVPGGLQAAEVAGLPLAAFSPPQNPALRLGLGSFPAATAPAGPTPETGEEEEEGNVARRTRLPASRAPLPVPASDARTEPPPQDEAGAGHRQVKPLGSLIPASCPSSSSSPGARSGSAWVRPCPPCPRGHVTGQLSSPPSHPAAAGPPAGARASPASHC